MSAQPEIYIVQNDAGDVVDVFRDADEATAAYGEGYSVIEETIWEPGEYRAAIESEEDYALVCDAQHTANTFRLEGDL